MFGSSTPYFFDDHVPSEAPDAGLTTTGLTHQTEAGLGWKLEPASS